MSDHPRCEEHLADPLDVPNVSGSALEDSWENFLFLFSISKLSALLELWLKNTDDLSSLLPRKGMTWGQMKVICSQLTQDFHCTLEFCWYMLSEETRFTILL